ncbi:MAG: RNA 3'-terminal phosphate cyclase [Nitrospirota bacterium]|nr:RNA 3'-terminal phosphate cyclase [Nitrospirota bacterium]
MIEIDGSYGEGGGQIVRTALSLSCLFQRPFRIFNIRKNRRKPGLMPQHLTCVKAAQSITGAAVKGDYPGSVELIFSPGRVRTGTFSFDIGTAGSTSLVLQTLIPALAFSGQMTRVNLTGGTHVPFSPSFHYLSEVFLRFLEQIGIRIRLSILSYGFYPRGGGKIQADIFPTQKITPLRINGRGNVLGFNGHSGVGNLPLVIAERQRSALLKKLLREAETFKTAPEIELLEVPTPGKGTFIDFAANCEHSIAGFTGLGEIGKKAEAVGEEAAAEFIRYYRTGAALDSHMADQIVLYLALCDEDSFFSSSAITNHLITNLWAIGLFHDIRCSLEGGVGEKGKVRLKGSDAGTALKRTNRKKGEIYERRQNISGKLQPRSTGTHNTHRQNGRDKRQAAGTG